MPGRLADLQQFLDSAKTASSAMALRDLLADFIPEQGFSYFALVDHVDLKRGQSPRVGLSNYPKTWTEMIWAKDYFRDDPVHAACQRTSVGFKWSDVPRIIEVTDKQKEILLSAEKEGLGEGFTVPIHVAGEFSASASFGLRYGQSVADVAMPVMQYVGCFAFEAARAIHRARAEEAERIKAHAAAAKARTPKSRNERPKKPSSPPELTGRQFDCVVLVAQGKSDWQIAQILDISEHTVHEHIENAKKRFGVATRAQLLVRALYTTQLTFRDIYN